MRTPGWIELVLLSLGVFRVVRFIGWDDLTARARAWVTIPDRDYDGWIQLQHDAEQAGLGWEDFLHQCGYAAPTGFRWWLARLVRCPWCAGAYVSVLVWVLWLVWPSGTVEVMVPLAIMAIVGLIAKQWDA